MEKRWLQEYFARYQTSIFETDVTKQIVEFRDCCLELKQNGGKLMLAGNGASASIASHGATDFTKQAQVRAVCFNESNLITAFANDYGYEHWVAEAIKAYGDKKDIAVLISSSGSSPNIVNAAKKAKDLGMGVITFSGFSSKNPLNSIGDLNFWLDSKAYNIIENTHQIWLTAVVDLLLGKAEYSVS